MSSRERIVVAQDDDQVSVLVEEDNTAVLATIAKDSLDRQSIHEALEDVRDELYAVADRVNTDTRERVRADGGERP